MEMVKKMKFKIKIIKKFMKIANLKMRVNNDLYIILKNFFKIDLLNN